MSHEQERRELIAAAREMSSSGLVVATWGNLSCRTGEALLITPSGMDYLSMTSDDLVLLDLSGKILTGRRKPSSESLLHAAVYRARPEVRAVVHVHSVAASAFAVARQSIPVILEETAQLIGHPISTAAYARCGSKELAGCVLQELGSNGQAVLLANHGVLTLGCNPMEALLRARIVEKSAKVMLYARQLGEVHALAAEEVHALREDFQHYGQPQ